MKQTLRLWIFLVLLAAGLVILSGCQRPKDEVVGRRTTPTVALALGSPQPTEPGTVTIGVETPPAGGIAATEAPGEPTPAVEGTPGVATALPGVTVTAVPTGIAGEATPGAATAPAGEAGATPAASPAPEATPGAAAAGETVTYTVQRGDTLFSIAQRYNTTVEAIRAENNLASNFIYVGQTLRITPGPGATTGATPAPATGGTYVVQAGDTLSSIARRYNTTVEALAQANGLTSPYVIYVGQRLTIPGAATVATPVPSGGTRTYVVQRGDTLYSIARRHGTTVEAIRQANGLTGNLIYVGQTLVIP